MTTTLATSAPTDDAVHPLLHVVAKVSTLSSIANATETTVIHDGRR